MLTVVFLIACAAAAQGQPTPQGAPAKLLSQFGGFIDVGYLRDFNDPANHLFRSRGTTFHVNELDVNMAGLYVSKQTTSTSRWGAELTAHAGTDSEVFGFSATAPNLRGSNWLTHSGPTNGYDPGTWLTDRAGNMVDTFRKRKSGGC